jgi:tRNA U34 5-methylaminomethyl-2-thiouridine-forming methyltransferase MnmC
LSTEGRKIVLTEDGSSTLFSSKFGATFHSRHGAIRESEHIFINYGLKLVPEGNLSILEMGFGSGLNAFLTLLEAQKSGCRIHYASFEKYPLTTEEYRALNYPEILGGGEWFNKLHQASWDQSIEIYEGFTLKKLKRAFESLQALEQYDLVYYDPFAPAVQSHLWELPMLSAVYTSMRDQGILTTYCAKGSFKRALRELGFKVQSYPGPPGKREMTVAIKRSFP